VECKICNIFKTNSFRGLSLHISNKHNISIKKYYDDFMKKTDESKCKQCGNETQFLGLSKGYRIYCSSKCSRNSELTIQKTKKTKIKRYGDENYVNAEKSSKTWKNKSKKNIQIIIEKRKKTNAEKYGDENFTNREKSQKTCLEKYGDENFTNRDKFVNTCLEKYGLKNVFQEENIKQKIKDYFQNKYNVNHPMKVEEIKNKTINKTKNFYMNKNKQLFEKYFDILEYKNEDNIHVKCKKCSKDYWIQKQYLIWRLNKNINPCHECYDISNISINEKELLNFIIENYKNQILVNDRSIISPQEIDIYLPDLKLAFEFNGLHWHNELYIDKKYHLNKTIECEKQGIHLVHIYEDDWIYKQDIVKSRILNLLGKSKKIFARKTEIKEVSYKDSKEFLEKNHIQGDCMSKFRFGLYTEEELVSLMTFGKLRKNLGQLANEDSYELLRFCNKLNTTIVGGANKLFKYFIKNQNPKEVISYADRSWTMNNGNTLYDKLGFKLLSISIPNYYYVHGKIRKNRFGYRKDVLISEGFDKNKSEHQIMLERGIYRIYNSGNLKFVFK
jgi:hypothetical protein